LHFFAVKIIPLTPIRNPIDPSTIFSSNVSIHLFIFRLSCGKKSLEKKKLFLFLFSNAKAQFLNINSKIAPFIQYSFIHCENLISISTIYFTKEVFLNVSYYEILMFLKTLIVDKLYVLLAISTQNRIDLKGICIFKLFVSKIERRLKMVDWD